MTISLQEQVRLKHFSQGTVITWRKLQEFFFKNGILVDMAGADIRYLLVIRAPPPPPPQFCIRTLWKSLQKFLERNLCEVLY